MSWHVHKKVVMLAVNLYNEFPWAQENFDAGVDEKQVISL